MKVKDIINEMTLRWKSFDSAATAFGDKNKELWLAQGIHIADIENLKVLRDGNYYSLWDNNTLVAFASLSDTDNTVDDVWVNKDYRGQKIFSKMLWFFKSRLNRSPLQLGKIHSSDMQAVVNGLSIFKKYWKNIKTNEIQPFNTDTVDDFYSESEVTPWRLFLENNGDFTDWPMFTEGKSFIKETYTEYIE